MQSELEFWINAIVILLAILLLGIRILFPDKTREAARKAARMEKETLLILLQEVIYSLRTPEAAHLMTAALLKGELSPFVRF